MHGRKQKTRAFFLCLDRCVWYLRGETAYHSVLERRAGKHSTPVGIVTLFNTNIQLFPFIETAAFITVEQGRKTEQR